MFDISQSSTVTIENTLSTQETVFLGAIKPSIGKYGYDEKRTIYGKRKLKYSAKDVKINISVNFIDEENKQMLENFFLNNTKINIIDQNNKTYPNLQILGEYLDFETKYDDYGDEFFITSFEVGV